MIGITNKDTSFFSIKTKDIFIKSAVGNNITDLIENDVISLSVEEQMNQGTLGAVTLYDPFHYYSDKLIEGIEVEVAWGYKNFSEILRNIIIKKPTNDEIESTADRRGLKALIRNPEGGGSQGGVNTYTFEFLGSEVLRDKEIRKFETGQRKDIIKELMEKLEIKVDNQVIFFDSGTTNVTKDTAVRQDSTPFKLLVELSRQWNALFYVTRNRQSELIGVFVSPKDFDLVEGLIQKVFGVSGKLRTFQYKEGEFTNVISYTWKRHIGDAVIGDNVRVFQINGVMHFQRFAAKQETVKTWVLKPDRMKKKLKGEDNIADATALFSEWLKVKDFDKIKEFFLEVENTTAPQGLGYSVNLKLYGDPMITPILRVAFDKGFPSRLQQKQKKIGKDVLGSIFYVRKAVHTVDRTGYKTDCEVGDVVSITGGSLVGV